MLESYTFNQRKLRQDAYWVRPMQHLTVLSLRHRLKHHNVPLLIYYPYEEQCNSKEYKVSELRNKLKELERGLAETPCS